MKKNKQDYETIFCVGDCYYRHEGGVPEFSWDHTAKCKRKCKRFGYLFKTLRRFNDAYPMSDLMRAYFEEHEGNQKATAQYQEEINENLKEQREFYNSWATNVANPSGTSDVSQTTPYTDEEIEALGNLIEDVKKDDKKGGVE